MTKSDSVFSGAASAPCKICEASDFHGNYASDIGERMKRDGICFTCAFWEMRAEAGCPTVIDNCVYSPGNNTNENSRADFRGCAGRRFDIEYLDDGQKITTFDLWVGGVVPERWRERIPNTAKFLSGAERVMVGGGACFNDSRTSAPPYPLPKFHAALSKVEIK